MLLLDGELGDVASCTGSLGRRFIRCERRQTCMKSILIRAESRRQIAGFCGTQLRKKDQNMIC